MQWNGENHGGFTTLIVACNFYKNEVVWDSKMDLNGYETLLSNYSEQNIEGGKITLKEGVKNLVSMENEFL